MEIVYQTFSQTQAKPLYWITDTRCACRFLRSHCGFIIYVLSFCVIVHVSGTIILLLSLSYRCCSAATHVSSCNVLSLSHFHRRVVIVLQSNACHRASVIIVVLSCTCHHVRAIIRVLCAIMLLLSLLWHHFPAVISVSSCQCLHASVIIRVCVFIVVLPWP